MKPKRSLASALFELVTVLLVTVAAFAWGKTTARIERGYNAVGGEYLLLLLPVIYYIGKRTVLDWVREFRKSWRGSKKKPPPMPQTSRTGGRKAKSNNHPHYMGE